METGIFIVWDTTTLFEARDDIIFYPAEQGNILGKHRQIIGGSRTG
jgi:hypothetical protein